MVSANYSLTIGLWHSVILETNFVEVMLVLDHMFVASAPETNYKDILNGDLVFVGDKVRKLIDVWRDNENIFFSFQTHRSIL